MAGASLTALDARFGFTAGAIVPTGWTPAEGSKALVLGSDVPGVFRKMYPAETIGVERTSIIFVGKLIRFRAHFRPITPTTPTPGDNVWFFTATLNGGTRLSRVFDPTRELDRFDFALPIDALVGPTPITIGFYLSFGISFDDIQRTELPGLYIDAILIDDETTSPILANRQPEPNEIGVPIDSPIYVEILNTTGNGNIIDPYAVYIGGVLAYSSVDGDHNGFTTGIILDGAEEALSITPPAPFPGQTVITVRVTASHVGESGDLDATYSFTTADITPPQVVSATAIDRRTVRVAFTEDILQSLAAGVHDAFNMANWAITLTSTSLDNGLPAVPLAVVGLATFDTRTLDVLTDLEMTPGALYRVTATNIADTSGNIIAAPTNFADFTGYSLAPPIGRDFELIRFLPELNSIEDAGGDLKRFIACLQEPTNMILADIDAWTNILDPDFADERFVDVMLVEAGNPFDFNLSLNDKRRLMRVLVPIFKAKGTDQGIINAVRFFLGIEITISTPWADGGWDLGVSELGVDTVLGTSDVRTRYTFIINSLVVLTDDQKKMISAIATYMKVAHTHFVFFVPPPPPDVPDHWELGLSSLGETTLLH